MIGQNQIILNINKYTIDTIPKTLLLIGDYGSGKHSIVLFLSNKFSLKIIDITNYISNNTINDIYINPAPAIYIVDADQLSDNQQNSLLKLTEEPPDNALIIILSESTDNIIQTLINRCIIFKLNHYTSKELSEFLDDTYTNNDKTILLNICSTPGQIKFMTKKSLDELIDISNKLINDIHKASYYNLLTIISKFNYNNRDDIHKLNIFINLLLYRESQNYMLNNNKYYYTSYFIIMKFKKMLRHKKFNFKNLITVMLTELWENSKNYETK